ncbi:MAG: antibiotic biosynthesis monooxygenase [bacterium]|nr:antibiotic biosynthesis monooxygenase [bacterium]
MKRRLKISGIYLIIFLFGVLSCQRKDTNELSDKNKQTKEVIEYTTLINSFEVPKDKLEESIIYWEACRDYLKTQPGYISTKLHQSLSGDAKFQLVNVAKWESPEAFMNASKKMNAELGVDPPEGLMPNASLYNAIRE